MTAAAEHWIDGARRGAGAAGTYEHAAAWRGGASKIAIPCAAAPEWRAAHESAERCLRALAFAPPSILSSSFERLEQALEGCAPAFAAAIEEDLGWSTTEAEEEVRRALAAFGAGLRGDSRALASAEPLSGRRPGLLVLRPPVDAPLFPLLRALGAALWGGNAVIACASSAAPRISIPLVEALERSGLHAGCAQVLFGRPAAFDEALRTFGERTVHETWSRWTPAEGEAAQAEGVGGGAARRLGEDRPALAAAIGPDAELPACVERFAAQLLARGGGGFEAARALFVHEDRASEICDALVELLGREPEDLECAPLVEDGAVRSAELFLRRALEEGAAIPVGGQADTRAGRRPGVWYEPTLLVNLPRDAQTVRARVRAPIAILSRYASLDDLVERVEHARMAHLWASEDLAAELRSLGVPERTALEATLGFGAPLPEGDEGLFDDDALRASK